MNDQADLASAPAEPEGVLDLATALPPAVDRTINARTGHKLGAGGEQCAPLPLGYRLHEYRIDAVLGQGGFGIAYAATDVNLNARVVVKEYLPEDFALRSGDQKVSARTAEDVEFYEAGLEGFLVEARTLATFRHPNIVRVARFFEANHTAYMVLEYERGQSLKSWRRRHELVPEATMVALLSPLLDGLALVHEAGYLHRDIKPDNIYVRDEDGSLVLLDFGAARQTTSEKTDVGSVVTPGYGPIEQYAGGGRQGPWTDIYSLGATLFWLITGRKPPEATARLDDPDPMPSIQDLEAGRYSPEFLCAIDWALAMHPSDRPQTVAEFRSMLFAAHAGALGLQEALKRGDDERAPRSLRARATRTFRNAFHPGHWPLAVKMTLAMVATAMLPMSITAWYQFEATSEATAKAELRNLEQLSRSIAGRIAQLLADSRTLADYVGTEEEFAEYLARPSAAGRAALREKLLGLVQSHPDLQFSMLMNAEGVAVVATDPEVAGRNFQFRDYFKQAMKGDAYMTGVVLGAVAGAAGFFHARPVHDRDGKVLGVFVMRIKAESVATILASEYAGLNRTPFLVDGDGVIVWHPDEKYMYRSLGPLAEEAQERIAADQRFRRARVESLSQQKLAAAMVGAKQAGNASYFSSLSQREEIAGFAPVPGHDWVVGVSESRDSFTAPLDLLFRTVLVSVAIVGGVFVVLGLLFARTIVRPLERLTAAAHALKSGDYQHANVEVRSGDEVGELSRTFNVMIDVLRQRERESLRNRALGSREDTP